jgi:hypothetical protein
MKTIPGASPRRAPRRIPRRFALTVLLALPALRVFMFPAGLDALGSAEKPAGNQAESRAGKTAGKAAGETGGETEARGIREYTLAISGVVRLAGNDPFPRLIVRTGDGKNYIVDSQAPAREQILAMQGRRVFMETLVREYPVYAGKKYLGTECVIFPAKCEPDGQ